MYDRLLRSIRQLGGAYVLKAQLEKEIDDEQNY